MHESLIRRRFALYDAGFFIIGLARLASTRYRLDHRNDRLKENTAFGWHACIGRACSRFAA